MIVFQAKHIHLAQQVIIKAVQYKVDKIRGSNKQGDITNLMDPLFDVSIIFWGNIITFLLL